MCIRDRYYHFFMVWNVYFPLLRKHKNVSHLQCRVNSNCQTCTINLSLTGFHSSFLLSALSWGKMEWDSATIVSVTMNHIRYLNMNVIIINCNPNFYKIIKWVKFWSTFDLLPIYRVNLISWTNSGLLQLLRSVIP